MNAPRQRYGRLSHALAALLCGCALLLGMPALAFDVTGLVFEDLDRDGMLDVGEPASGQTLWAKLLDAGTSGPAFQVVPVNTVSGAYAFTGVSAGDFQVRIDDNADPADVIPDLPGSWGFIAPLLGSQPVTVAAADVVGVDFALEASPPCTCGFGDGLFTLSPISVNGDMTDWDPVVADIDNVDCDPTGLTDRDYAVQSTGRDLISFAATWDNAALYTLTRRVGSTANINKFIYYADTNNNALMEDGEPVIVARWKGSNRTIQLYYGDYLADDPGGDPLVDGTGSGDGYTMPGEVQNLPSVGNPDASGTWGSADGRTMEWGLAWTVLDVSPGAAIGWHVASTNSEPGSASFPDQTDDNLAGCGGCSAGNTFAALTFEADGAATVPAGTTAALAHTLTNDGNGTDTFDFTSVSGGAFTPTTITYHQDLGVAGVFEPGTDLELTDTDGDTDLDSGPLIAGASLELFVVVAVPGAASGTATVTTTATSSFVPACGVGVPASADLDDVIEAVAGQSVSGQVYEDADHDAARDPGEGATGLTLYAKLVPGAAPAGPATQVVAVDLATGVYTFPGVAAGDYLIVLDDNATAADVTPSLPAGWLGTEAPTGSLAITVVAAPFTDLDFGLFHGSRLEGQVYLDDGAGGGTAGNGIQEGSEAGIPSLTVEATAAGCASACDSASTDGSGNFSLWLPFATDGQVVQVSETNLAGYLSTGGDPGTSGGSYDLPSDSISFTHVAGSAISGLRFGDLAGSAFSPDHQRTALPGSVVFYPHTFFAGTDGSVSFQTAAVSSPTLAEWANSVYHDADCNALLGAGEALLQPSDSIAVSAGGTVCILLRESVPPGAPTGAQDLVTVSANFAPAGGGGQALTVQDLTTVGSPTSAGLDLVKTVDKSSALPGEQLLYTITYRNTGVAPISDLVVFDATPAFTTFVGGSALCGAPLGATLLTCTPLAPAGGATGPVQWTFTGVLNPGATGEVTYSVIID